MSEQDVVQALAEQMADDLFVNGTGEHAERLVLTVDGPPRRELGGWCRGAVVDRMAKWLRPALAEREARIKELEARRPLTAEVDRDYLRRKLAEREAEIARLRVELSPLTGPTGAVEQWRNEAETNRQAWLKSEAAVARLTEQLKEAEAGWQDYREQFILKDVEVARLTQRVQELEGRMANALA